MNRPRFSIASPSGGGCTRRRKGRPAVVNRRATASFDGPAGGVWRAGFTFRTLRGHPELGEETFFVEKDAATGAVRVSLRSWSRPGLWLTRLVSPYARRVQVRACHAALDHLERTAKAAPAPSSVPTA